jgi:hypothetical protein
MRSGKDPPSLICSVLIGGFQIGQAAPYAEALATARSAAGNIYRVTEVFLFFQKVPNFHVKNVQYVSYRLSSLGLGGRANSNNVKKVISFI